jgi:hypothetical protein
MASVMMIVGRGGKMGRIRLDDELHDRIRRYCNANNIPIGQWTAEVLGRAVRLTEPPVKKMSPAAERIYRWVWQHGPATCAEIEAALVLTHQSASARVHDLMRAGRFHDTGDRRLTPAGRYATVWGTTDTPVRAVTITSSPARPEPVCTVKKKLHVLDHETSDVPPGSLPPFWARG